FRYPDGLGMKKRSVREIEDVVRAQLPMRGDVVEALEALPAFRREPPIVGDGAGIGRGGIAHPDPSEVPALDEGIGAHAHARGNIGLMRDEGAGAGGVELDAVIAAADRLGAAGAGRERRRAVRAAVLERADLPRAGAKQHDRLSADAPGERLRPELARKRGGVPLVLEEHDGLQTRGGGARSYSTPSSPR